MLVVPRRAFPTKQSNIIKILQTQSTISGAPYSSRRRDATLAERVNHRRARATFGESVGFGTSRTSSSAYLPPSR